MRDKKVRDAMTPLESVFMLNVDDKVGNVTMDTVSIVVIFTIYGSNY